MKANHLPLSLLLPKTGQITLYQAGDDGEYQSGWWKGLLNADNKPRFLIKRFNGDYVTIDLATGLMWAADGEAAGCNDGDIIRWATAIDFANALDFAGFTDWRLPNIKELMSIVVYELVNPAIDLTKFPDTHASFHWSSTTYKGITTRAWGINFGYGNASYSTKTSSFYLRCVRAGL